MQEKEGYLFWLYPVGPIFTSYIIFFLGEV